MSLALRVRDCVYFDLSERKRQRPRFPRLMCRSRVFRCRPPCDAILTLQTVRLFEATLMTSAKPSG